MKTSNIKEVVEITGDGIMYNGTYYHNLVMENEDRINIGKKRVYKEGESLDYEITEQGQHEFNKAKTPQKDFKAPASQPKDDTYIKGMKVGHALTNGVALFNAQGPVNDYNMTQSIKEYATVIYKLSEELNNEL